MNKSRVYLILQAVVCVALAALLAVSAVSICREGMARRALDPLASIYTPQIVARRLAAMAPLFFAGLGLLIAGLALGIRDEGGEKPVKGAYFARAAGQPARPKKQRAVQSAILALAAALIVAGVLNGSARDVLYKAITICTECVGLG